MSCNFEYSKYTIVRNDNNEVIDLVSEVNNLTAIIYNDNPITKDDWDSITNNEVIKTEVLEYLTKLDKQNIKCNANYCIVRDYKNKVLETE